MGARSTSDGGGRVRGVAVGVSRFADPDTRPLPFAAADARSFAAGLRGGTVRPLADADATAAAVRDALLDLVTTSPGDVVYVFTASHAAWDDGELSLAGYDGAVAAGPLLRSVWNSPARRVVLLLDLFRGTDADRPAASDLATLFPPRPGRSLLLADDGTHGSHVSGELQAGIWASHVAAAFSGSSPRAREPDGSLTAGSMRAFLADELARSLARAYTDGRQQSPVVLADSDDEVLAEPIESGADGDDAKPPLAGLRFVSEREVPVKALGGFRKGVHAAPSDTLASSRQWVARLAEPDLAKEVEEAAGRLRRHLGYKRRDLRADAPAGGAATILTPDFALHLTAKQHPSKADRAVFGRTLAEVRNPDVLGTAALAEAFPHGFLSLHFAFESPADVEALVDALEDAEPPGLARLDYPTDLAFCELELAGFDGKVRIERQGLTVSAAGPASPAELAARFAYVKRLLGAAGVP